MRFTASEKRTLLTLAGNAISERVAHRKTPPERAPDLTEALESRCGAFVSIYIDRQLRGCIGTFSEEEPLYTNVIKMAVAAAVSDSRFSPVQPDELAQLELEISVLTPRQRIYDPSEIVVGLHGIFMKQGVHRGTLLPQVAVNQNWTVREFLGNCSKYKAGIGWNGWKTAELYTYEAIVINSEQYRS